jgi:hypothetical protein
MLLEMTPEMGFAMDFYHFIIKETGAKGEMSGGRGEGPDS